MKTAMYIPVKGKQGCVEELRKLVQGSPLSIELENKFKQIYKKQLNSLIEYHNSINKSEATLYNITLFKSNYCGLGLDVVIQY